LAKEKIELDKIEICMSNTTRQRTMQKKEKIYKAIDSISGVASKFSIANEYDKMMTAMGAQGTNAFTL
jgi:hypothetical protein